MTGLPSTDTFYIFPKLIQKTRLLLKQTVILSDSLQCSCDYEPSVPCTFIERMVCFMRNILQFGVHRGVPFQQLI